MTHATSPSYTFETALFILFWTILIFLSIAWYGFLLFYIGVKGAHEIKALTKALAGRDEGEKSEGAPGRD